MDEKEYSNELANAIYKFVCGLNRFSYTSQEERINKPSWERYSTVVQEVNDLLAQLPNYNKINFNPLGIFVGDGFSLVNGNLYGNVEKARKYSKNNGDFFFPQYVAFLLEKESRDFIEIPKEIKEDYPEIDIGYTPKTNISNNPFAMFDLI